LRRIALAGGVGAGARVDLPQGATARVCISAGVMRLLFIAPLVFFGCLLAPKGAAAITPGELLQSCQSVANAAVKRGGAIVDIPESGLPCWYYMSAVQNMAVLVDESGTRLLDVCPPADSTVLDFVRIFVQYARKQTAAAKSGAENAAALALPGLAKAFPCR